MMRRVEAAVRDAMPYSHSAVSNYKKAHPNCF